MSSPRRLALYTTVYPQLRPYFADWYASLKVQTDRDVDVWIGLDRCTPEDVWEMAGEHFDFTPVIAEPGLSVAGLRQQAFAPLAERYFGVIFTDADDWMLPDRVAQARADLDSWDGAACAMRVVATDGSDLDQVFRADASAALEDCLVERNAFGLSNTAYRGDLLRRLLPIPPGIVLVDWLLAARAWALGARLRFNPAVLMAYRQYPQNTARVLPPFTAEQVINGAWLVLDHYALMLDAGWPLPAVARARLEGARQWAVAFQRAMLADPARLDAYTRALNALPADHIWWSFVAHPQLEELWKS